MIATNWGYRCWGGSYKNRDPKWLESNLWEISEPTGSWGWLPKAKTVQITFTQWTNSAKNTAAVRQKCLQALALIRQWVGAHQRSEMHLVMFPYGKQMLKDFWHQRLWTSSVTADMFVQLNGVLIENRRLKQNSLLLKVYRRSGRLHIWSGSIGMPLFSIEIHATGEWVRPQFIT